MTSTAVLSPAVPAWAAATPEVATWRIDPVHTHVEFAVRHLMVATVKGRLGEVEGTITFDEADPTGSSVDVRIAAASVDTREPQRDAHLRSADFLDAERHPYLTFKSRRIEPGGNGEFTAYGDLTIRGVTREVALEGEYLGTSRSPYGFQVAGFSARTRINRKDYGLNWNAALETGGVLVGDEVRINLEVEAIRQSAEQPGQLAA
jgi:polyisoprenoid-binding protein YceI